MDEYVIDFLVDGWSEKLADRMLEQINRQKDPVLRRRLVASQLRMVALRAVCDAVQTKQEEREEC